MLRAGCNSAVKSIHEYLPSSADFVNFPHARDALQGVCLQVKVQELRLQKHLRSVESFQDLEQDSQTQNCSGMPKQVLARHDALHLHSQVYLDHEVSFA